MRLDELSVELRPRSAWEAVELGTALVRRHAGAIWRPWLWVTLPIFVILNAVGWALDRVWLAALLMWWAKPLFDRIPLYVMSRAVFGAAPGPRETVRAHWRWGIKPMLGYMTWRRLGAVRSLYLPIDLLEGGPRPAQRRSIVGSGVRGTAALVTLVCANFEAVLVFGVYVLALMFVPVELMTESARAAWTLLTESPPRWVQLLGNIVAWAATSVIEPFYVGAGFGLYLDRRTRIEAWDVEIAFRRLHARLLGAGVALLCLFALALPAFAQGGQDVEARNSASTPAVTDATPAAKPAPGLDVIFGRVDEDPGFARAAGRLGEDPLLNPKRTVSEWVRRHPNEEQTQLPDMPWLQAIAKAIAAIAQYGLWILLGVLVILLAATYRTWMPWLSGMAPRKQPVPVPVEHDPHAEAEPLPDDVMARARALWAKGQPRRALSLLYRASVAAMVARTGVLLVPGATEAQCLRASRSLGEEEDRSAFARMVRTWQYAAYAERMPDAAEFDSLLVTLGRRFGWSA